MGKITCEKELIERAQQNKNAFAELYEMHFHEVFCFVSRRVESNDFAKEITSIVFAKALTNIKKYTYRGVPFIAWLIRISQNELYKWYRKNKTVRYVEINEDSLSVIIETEDNNEEYFKTFLPQLKSQLKNLKKEELTLIELRFFDNYSFSEIAEILHMKETNARVKTHKYCKN